MQSPSPEYLTKYTPVSDHPLWKLRLIPLDVTVVLSATDRAGDAQLSTELQQECAAPPWASAERSMDDSWVLAKINMPGISIDCWTSFFCRYIMANGPKEESAMVFALFSDPTTETPEYCFSVQRETKLQMIDRQESDGFIVKALELHDNVKFWALSLWVPLWMQFTWRSKVHHEIHRQHSLSMSSGLTHDAMPKYSAASDLLLRATPGPAIVWWTSLMKR